jgi:hypothetical protein
MQTDIPLKRFTALRAADLLPLLGAAGQERCRLNAEHFRDGHRFSLSAHEER